MARCQFLLVRTRLKLYKKVASNYKFISERLQATKSVRLGLPRFTDVPTTYEPDSSERLTYDALWRAANPSGLTELTGQVESPAIKSVCFDAKHSYNLPFSRSRFHFLSRVRSTKEF